MEVNVINYDNNENNNQRNETVIEKVIKSCKKLSIYYILTWLLIVGFTIGAWYCFGYYQVYNLELLDSIYSEYCGFIACIVIVCILSLVLIWLGINLILDVNILKSHYSHLKPNEILSKSVFTLHNQITLMFELGLLFFGIFSIVGSFLTINFCNDLEDSNYKNQNN